MKVLDIGCGTGGSAFYMAEKYGVHVLGVDLSQNMLDIGKKIIIKLDSQVFIFSPNFYDFFPSFYNSIYA